MNRRRIVSLSIFVFWMLIIFLFSAQPKEESNALSMKVAEVVTEKVIPENIVEKRDFNIDSLNSKLRTHAHFFLYLVLGILAMNFFNGLSKYRVLVSLLICILYAISDEFHQIFVPGRGAQISDIIVDTLGATFGIFISWSMENLLILKRSSGTP